MNSPVGDRRNRSRNPLFHARRRYPRISAECDVFYDGEQASLFTRDADVSLRGMFLPCRFPDLPGVRGQVRIDAGQGPMVRAVVEVVRVSDDGRRGMALRFVAMSEPDRLRLAAFLIRRGGLASIPQLDRCHHTLALAPRPRSAV